MTTVYVASCDCGYERRHRSEAMARHRLARHSCDRYEAIAARRARGAARKAAVDRTPKPCRHPQTQHQHGTYACYVLDGCKCLPCSRANSQYERDRTRQQAYGRWNGLVDAAPALQHVQGLMAQGMGLKRIVAVSGVPQGVLWKLVYGKRRDDGSRVTSRRIKPDTERRLLATQLDLAGGARVPSIGAVRRVQALVALGWSQSKIARRLGVRPTNFQDLAHGHRAEVVVATDKAVRALYAEWSMQLPPAAEWRDKIAASRSRNYARARGWLPPLAWDDDALDDPTAVPLTGPVDDGLDETAVLRRMAGDRDVRLTKAEQVEVVRRLLAEGVAKNEIERRTGLNVYRYREALDAAS